MFSSRYNAVTQSKNRQELYNKAKKGDSKAEYELISQLLTENDINKIKSFGDDAYLMDASIKSEDITAETDAEEKSETEENVETLLKSSPDNDIIEESTSENEVTDDGNNRAIDDVGQPNSKVQEESGRVQERITGTDDSGRGLHRRGEGRVENRALKDVYELKEFDNLVKVVGNEITNKQSREGARRVNGVFHGTTYQFLEFLKSYVDLGVHFGSESQARSRATDDGYIIKRDLILKNPLKTKDIFGERTPREYVIELIENSELLPNEKESLFKEFNVYCETDISAQAKKSLDEKLASEKYQNICVL